jgi:hypothetical protein
VEGVSKCFGGGEGSSTVEVRVMFPNIQFKNDGAVKTSVYELQLVHNMVIEVLESPLKLLVPFPLFNLQS